MHAYIYIYSELLHLNDHEANSLYETHFKILRIFKINKHL